MVDGRQLKKKHNLSAGQDYVMCDFKDNQVI